jgi:hypothetical protein
MNGALPKSFAEQMLMRESNQAEKRRISGGGIQTKFRSDEAK